MRHGIMNRRVSKILLWWGEEGGQAVLKAWERYLSGLAMDQGRGVRVSLGEWAVDIFLGLLSFAV